MSKPAAAGSIHLPQQYHARFFFGKKLNDEWAKKLIVKLPMHNIPPWVYTATRALQGNMNHLQIIVGGWKVAIINQNHVYTFEILSPNKRLEKEQKINMLRQIPNVQVKLPIDTCQVQLDDDYDAYFTLTDYCNEVFTLLYNNKFPKPLLNHVFISLMETYRTLCDYNVYLVDIKPENMLLCSDGLYFIDIDDISIVRKEYIDISNTTTRYFNTADYKSFVKEHQAFMEEHQAFMKEHTDIVFSPDAAEQLEEIRERLEYEGWQALVKTYFYIEMNVDRRKQGVTLIDWSYGQARNYAYDPKRKPDAIGKYIVGMMNPSTPYYDQNGKIRAWLNNVLSTREITSEDMDTSLLLAIDRLRF